jgi:hypothetical protein
MTIYRKYEYDGGADYVQFRQTERKNEYIVSSVSLQEKEWYLFQAVWEMKRVPRTAEEYYETSSTDANICAGWSCGSWANVKGIEKEDMNEEHEEIIKHFEL